MLRALSQILQQILSESENDIRLFYDNLKAHLGAQFCNIKLLAEFIPELNTLVFDPIHDNNNNNEAAPSDAYSMDNDETQARFHNVFIETLRVITHWKMVTLVRIFSVCMILPLLTFFFYMCSSLTIYIKLVEYIENPLHM